MTDVRSYGRLTTMRCMRKDCGGCIRVKEQNGGKLFTCERCGDKQTTPAKNTKPPGGPLMW